MRPLPVSPGPLQNAPPTLPVAAMVTHLLSDSNLDSHCLAEARMNQIPVHVTDSPSTMRPRHTSRPRGGHRRQPDIYFCKFDSLFFLIQYDLYRHELNRISSCWRLEIPALERQEPAS